MLNYYSCLDPCAVAPQPEQHQIIAKMATDLQGKVVFYGSEDYFCAKTQTFIYPKLKRTPDLNGVIFFTFDQFLYAQKLKISLMRKILDLNLTVNFAREQISITNQLQLRNSYLFYRAYHHARDLKISTLMPS